MTEAEQIEAFIRAGKMKTGPARYAAPSQHGPDKWDAVITERPKRAGGGGFGKMWAKRRQLLGVKP